MTTRARAAWNDFRSAFRAKSPTEDEGSLRPARRAIRACSDEVETGPLVRGRGRGTLIRVDAMPPDTRVDRLLVGVCNRGQGGGLGQAKRVSGAAQRPHAGRHPGARPIDRVPEQPQPPDHQADRPADRPGGPQGRGRGCRLADDAGPAGFREDHGTPGLRRLAEGRAPAEPPEVAPDDPGSRPPAATRPRARAPAAAPRTDAVAPAHAGAGSRPARSSSASPRTAPALGDDHSDRADAPRGVPGQPGERQDHPGAEHRRAAPPPGDAGHPGRSQGGPLRLRREPGAWPRPSDDPALADAARAGSASGSTSPSTRPATRTAARSRSRSRRRAWAGSARSSASRSRATPPRPWRG